MSIGHAAVTVEVMLDQKVLCVLCGKMGMSPWLLAHCIAGSIAFTASWAACAAVQVAPNQSCHACCAAKQACPISSIALAVLLYFCAEMMQLDPTYLARYQNLLTSIYAH